MENLFLFAKNFWLFKNCEIELASFNCLAPMEDVSDPLFERCARDEQISFTDLFLVKAWFAVTKK